MEPKKNLHARGKDLKAMVCLLTIRDRLPVTVITAAARSLPFMLDGAPKPKSKRGLCRCSSVLAAIRTLCAHRRLRTTVCSDDSPTSFANSASAIGCVSTVRHQIVASYSLDHQAPEKLCRPRRWPGNYTYRYLSFVSKE